MLTLFFRIFSVLCVAWAEAPEAPTHLDYRIDANMLYFSSSTNYLAGGGSSQDLNNGGYFTDLITTALYTQDLDRSRRFYGGFNYSMTESYDGSFTRSNAGLSELLAGGQYWLKVLGYQMAPTFDFVYPLVRIDRSTDDALLAEGAMKMRFGSWLLLGHETWVPFIYLGYEYRDEGRSHAVPYSAGIKWRSKPMWAQFEYRGYERLFANSDTENRDTRDVFLQRVNGGSYRYYSINPALSEAAIEAGYSFGTFAVYGGLAATVNGSSSAQGYSGMIGVAYTPGADTSEPKEDLTAPVDIPDRFTPAVDPFDELDPTRPPKKVKRKPTPPPPPPEDLPTDAAPAPTAPAPLKPPQQAPSSGGPLPDVQLRPAPKKGSPVAPAPKAPPAKARPKPVKKNKTDKMLDEAEKNLKSL